MSPRGLLPGGWTLRRRLVIGVAALVTLALLGASVATLLTLRASLFDRLDEEVLAGLEFAGGPEPAPPRLGDGTGPAPRVGTLQVVMGADGEVASSTYVADDGSQATLTTRQLEALEEAVATERVPVTVDLGGTLGHFRVAADGRVQTSVISGRSQDDVTATLTALAWILATVMAITLVAVASGAAALVSIALRPLKRVAATAELVSARPLAEGSVSLPERAALAEDPRTEVGRVGASLDRLLGHVESALAARQHSEERLRRFIADASHELRTPLASIRGYAQLSHREGASMTPIQARALDRIESESQRMESLVEDLLLLARLDAGQSLRRDTVDLTKLVIDAVDDAHVAAPDHEWILDVDEPVEVPGDENRLRQVITNLVANARIHTPTGTRVVVAVERAETEATITVTDDGPGIPHQLQARLFERFARGDEARTRSEGSTGLGLAISHAIVVAHRGELSATSAPGSTSFRVALPFDPSRPVPASS